jgi:hypothetical protein
MQIRCILDAVESPETRNGPMQFKLIQNIKCHGYSGLKTGIDLYISPKEVDFNFCNYIGDEVILELTKLTEESMDKVKNPARLVDVKSIKGKELKFWPHPCYGLRHTSKKLYGPVVNYDLCQAIFFSDKETGYRAAEIYLLLPSEDARDLEVNSLYQFGIKPVIETSADTN